MALTAGTRLGPYEILSPIGKGGMGEVYKANDTRLDRTVAIKVLPEHLAESPERKARFEREAKAISQLNHPHICTLHDVGEQDGIDFIVMEYIEGETLAERLKKGALPLDKALEYGFQIADGLAPFPTCESYIAAQRIWTPTMTSSFAASVAKTGLSLCSAVVGNVDHLDGDGHHPPRGRFH